MTELLNVMEVCKSFQGNLAVDHASLTVEDGSITGLIGANGAGKTTLFNCVSGYYRATSGRIFFQDREIQRLQSQKLCRMGIARTFQIVRPFGMLSVLDNAVVGGFNRASGRKEAYETAEKCLDIVGLTDKAQVPAAVLNAGEQRKLELARALATRPRLLLLDEVMAVADGMTVLRDGEFVARKEIRETSVVEIAELMIGRKVEKLIDEKTEDKRTISPDKIAVRLKNYYVDMPGEQVKGIDLDIRKGEIFGIGGLAGQGKLGIPNGILGLYPAQGQVEINGEPLKLDKLGDALEHKTAFVSEDRRGVGLLLDQSIEENIIFSAMQTNNKFLKKIGWMHLFDSAAARVHAQKMVETLDIRCTGIKQAAGRLSGGNQQKVCLARALTLEPDILFVSEPTRGIDIGAKKLVLEYLAKLNREQGMTVVIVSSELVELRSIADRIGIVSDGKLACILKPDASDADFGLAMSGAWKGGENNEKSV